jgi:hypothetical protein
MILPFGIAVITRHGVSLAAGGLAWSVEALARTRVVPPQALRDASPVFRNFRFSVKAILNFYLDFTTGDVCYYGNCGTARQAMVARFWPFIAASRLYARLA